MWFSRLKWYDSERDLDALLIWIDTDRYVSIWLHFTLMICVWLSHLHSCLCHSGYFDISRHSGFNYIEILNYSMLPLNCMELILRHTKLLFFASFALIDCIVFGASYPFRSLHFSLCFRSDFDASSPLGHRSHNRGGGAEVAFLLAILEIKN